MASLVSLLGSALFALPVLSLVTPHKYYKRDLTDFIDTERAISLDGVLANIGSDGALSMGAFPGVVIASPSTVRSTLPNMV